MRYVAHNRVNGSAGDIHFAFLPYDDHITKEVVKGWAADSFPGVSRAFWGGYLCIVSIHSSS